MSNKPPCSITSEHKPNDIHCIRVMIFAILKDTLIKLKFAEEKSNDNAQTTLNSAEV